MSGLMEILPHIVRAWKTKRDQIDESSMRIYEWLRNVASQEVEGDISHDVFKNAFIKYEQIFDREYGGFWKIT